MNRTDQASLLAAEAIDYVREHSGTGWPIYRIVLQITGSTAPASILTDEDKTKERLHMYFDARSQIIARALHHVRNGHEPSDVLVELSELPSQLVEKISGSAAQEAFLDGARSALHELAELELTEELLAPLARTAQDEMVATALERTGETSGLKTLADILRHYWTETLARDGVRDLFGSGQSDADVISTITTTAHRVATDDSLR